jgi:hypothetical protein
VPVVWDGKFSRRPTGGRVRFAPEGVRHGPHAARTEVISLTIFDGPLTVA